MRNNNLTEIEYKQQVYKDISEVVGVFKINKILLGHTDLYGVSQNIINKKLEEIPLKDFLIISKHLFLEHIRICYSDLYTFLTKNEYPLDFERYYTRLEIMSEHMASLFMTNKFTDLIQYWKDAKDFIVQIKIKEREEYLKEYEIEQRKKEKEEAKQNKKKEKLEKKIPLRVCTKCGKTYRTHEYFFSVLCDDCIVEEKKEIEEYNGYKYCDYNKTIHKQQNKIFFNKNCEICGRAFSTTDENIDICKSYKCHEKYNKFTKLYETIIKYIK